MSQTNLMPEFDQPPVTEVALSIAFAPLMHLTASNILSFWKEVTTDYPKIEMQPPLPSEIEQFGEVNWQPPSAFRIEAMSPDANRFWFISNSSNWLIQIQKDRFVLNWRKVNDEDVYPRYLPTLRPRLEREWGKFKNFITQLGDECIDITQCEVTYVNDLIKDKEWRTLPEAMGLISPLSANVTNQFLPSQESMSYAGSYLLPEGKGRLRFQVGHVIRQPDKREAVQMRLVARGRPSSSFDNDLFEWLDLGREWIVKGFTDLTTSKAHTIWGRKIDFTCDNT